ncbi:hypothetical protein DSO57_1013137 [Entomophthora muscae]|uniref:Uncharacterized protein n=2 Tax=Entomophthora muscae TaxID=34485 RepID=A0ACC2SQI6_9FUNG|nr:hypothetical protein DSO57_1029555 [Entomophthora muscae]KAJ9073711.1 hypothetical protein DSO57_1013137 [Entomophthora muscae]
MDGPLPAQDGPQGVLVRPLINGCVIRNIVTGSFFLHDGPQELQAQVILGKETHLELLLVDIFPGNSRV